MLKRKDYHYNANNRPKRHRLRYAKLLFCLVILVGAGFLIKREFLPSTVTPALATSSNKVAASPAEVAKPVAVNPCASNTLDQLVLVSISKRELWACSANQLSYSSSVITGMDFLAADLTPTGTYHVYAKETDIHLIGHDSTGSWNDFVNYWMPFLDNQYGAYGFHDATWRAANAFGNISPGSPQASHGCVECPLATAKWLYGWAQIGTTVTIES